MAKAERVRPSLENGSEIAESLAAAAAEDVCRSSKLSVELVPDPPATITSDDDERDDDATYDTHSTYAGKGIAGGDSDTGGGGSGVKNHATSSRANKHVARAPQGAASSKCVFWQNLGF